ncbi:hypothetical protein [Methylomonas sp. HYX-M1]|uniref:hypothetical protein n=1 Tax=Methylomonas sp. HYX-M1 TaxID=3139307 RepID=UPI00345C39E1
MSSHPIRIWQAKLCHWVSQIGLVDTLLYAFKRIVCSLSNVVDFDKYYFVSQRLNNAPLLPEGKGKSFDIVEITSDSAPSHPCPRPVEVIKDRYQQGAKCLAVFKLQEFCGCLWFVSTEYKEDEFRCRYRLPNTAVWDFDVYVDPKYRFSPAFLKLWDEASFRLCSEGYKCSISRISAFNPVSLSSHKRMGAVEIGWACFLKIKSLQFSLASIKPYVHLSWRDEAMPVFNIQTTGNN